MTTQDRQMLTIGVGCATVVTGCACGALFGYAANAEPLQWGAGGLGIGLLLAWLAAGIAWSESK